MDPTVRHPCTTLADMDTSVTGGTMRVGFGWSRSGARVGTRGLVVRLLGILTRGSVVAYGIQATRVDGTRTGFAGAPCRPRTTAPLLPRAEEPCAERSLRCLFGGFGRRGYVLCC